MELKDKKILILVEDLFMMLRTQRNYQELKEPRLVEIVSMCLILLVLALLSGFLAFS